MAKSIFGLLLSNSTVDTFRAWGSGLSTRLGSILTRVTQTNDINWSTVALPTSNNFATGGEVYRFDDPLQSTAPIFIRFEYGTASSSNVPQIRVTVGKAADGNGSLTGILVAATSMFLPSLVSTGSENCFISGGNSWFALSLAPSSSQRGGMFVVERSVSPTGQPTAEALLVGIQNIANAQQQHRFIDYVNATSESVTGGIVAVPLSLSSDRSIANGTAAPIFPAACISPSGIYWRPRVILGTARQNAGLGEVITGLLDGNTYLALGAGSQGVDQRSGSFSATLIRWD